MPSVTGKPGDYATATSSARVGIGLWPAALSNHATDGRCAEAQPRPTEHLRHALVTHRWEQSLQLPHEISDKIGVTIHRLDGLNEISLSVLIEPTHPRLRRLRVEQEHPRSLLQIPPASRPEPEESHALSRCVMGSSPGPRALPATILDAQFFPKQGHLGLGLLELDGEPTMTGRTAAGIGEDDAGQRDGVQDAGLHMGRPLRGQTDWASSCHSGLRLNGEESPA